MRSYILFLVFYSISALINTVYANQPYQHEIIPEYTQSNFDVNTGLTKREATGFQWTIFFNPINTDAGPLDQASFLSPESSISIKHSKTDFDFGGPTPSDADLDSTYINLSLITKEKIIFEFTFGEDDMESRSATRSVSENTKTRDYSIGYYLQPNLAVALSRTDRENNDSGQVRGCS